MKWYIEDDCTSKAAAIWTEEMKATTKTEAEDELRKAWNRMTAYEQRRRDSFRAVYGELDEDGCLDYDTIVDEVAL